MVNKVILIGNLGADPEMRYTPSGTPVATLRLATSRKWKDKDGNPQDETEWHRVIVWSQSAEYCSNYLSKGSKVYIEGRLHTGKWKDQNGNDRYTTEIIASTVQTLTGAGNAENRDNSHDAGSDQDQVPGDQNPENDIPF